MNLPPNVERVLDTLKTWMDAGSESIHFDSLVTAADNPAATAEIDEETFGDVVRAAIEETKS